MKSHSSPPSKKPFECKDCNRRFTTEVLKTRHEIIHSDLVELVEHKNQSCIVCGETFLEKVELESHVKNHKNDKDHSCRFCSKSFESVKFQSFIRHLKIHDETKTHICKICNKLFHADGSELIDHLNKHKGFLPHQCHLCDKSYLQSSKLKVHLRTHSNLKEFLCTECGKSFNRASNLRQHVLRHSGVKNYACSFCPSKFVSKGLS